jgi:mono/diheme cytochrome c family protein
MRAVTLTRISRAVAPAVGLLAKPVPASALDRRALTVAMGAGFLALLAAGHELRAAPPAADAGAPSEQLARGEDIYFSSCAECHNSDLRGGAAHAAPPLVGDVFLKRWAGRSARDLLELARATMPEGQPRSLTDQAYLDVIAFVLKRNKIAAGEGALTERDTERISMN